MRITVGRFIITRVRAPAIRDVPILQNRQKNSIPTRPYIIEGIPESVSAAYSMALTTRLFEAYSVRYIAAPTPSGTTISIVAITMYSVFIRSGSMPMLSAR